MNYRILLVSVLAFLLAVAIWGEQAIPMPSIAHAQSDFSCANVSEIPLVECEALVAISDANPPGIGWLTSDTPCSWDRVTCANGQINFLGLEFRGLTSLPPEIGNLTNLAELDLSGNRLTSLPPEFGNLNSLIDLSLWENQLTSLPPEFGNLTNLIRLYLDENQLARLAPELNKLPQLQVLSIEGYPLIPTALQEQDDPFLHSGDATNGSIFLPFVMR